MQPAQAAWKLWEPPALVVREALCRIWHTRSVACSMRLQWPRWDCSGCDETAMVASTYSLQAHLLRGSTYTITRVSGASDQPQWLVTDNTEQCRATRATSATRDLTLLPMFDVASCAAWVVASWPRPPMPSPGGCDLPEVWRKGLLGALGRWICITKMASVPSFTRTHSRTH